MVSSFLCHLDRTTEAFSFFTFRIPFCWTLANERVRSYLQFIKWNDLNCSEIFPWPCIFEFILFRTSTHLWKQIHKIICWRLKMNEQCTGLYMHYLPSHLTFARLFCSDVQCGWWGGIIAVSNYWLLNDWNASNFVCDRYEAKIDANQFIGEKWRFCRNWTNKRANAISLNGMWLNVYIHVQTQHSYNYIVITHPMIIL